MDLSKYLSGGEPPVTEEQPRMSKEEYAALKKQEREEVWAEIDAKAQDVFKDGDSLKGFLDFMAQCKPQKTPNLLLLYSQNPEIRQVMTFEKVKEEGYSLRAGVHGYRFLVTQAVIDPFQRVTHDLVCRISTKIHGSHLPSLCS